jgi:hypothetical protein
VLGSAATLRLLVIAAALFPLLAVALAPATAPRRWLAVASGVAVAGVAVALWLPGAAGLWSRLHGVPPDRLIHGEDGSGLSVLRTMDTPDGRGAAIMYVNGLGQSWLPYGGVHSMLGALPAFLHDNPRDAAVIGLGSGDTVFALAGRASLERIASIEIVRPLLDTLRRLDEVQPYAGVRALLRDPRIDHVYGDGRLHLMQTSRRYDIIEADALRPTSAYAGHLYSDAYFRLVRGRLAPRGLAVTWSPTSRVLDTFISVFPHVLRFGDIVVGSNEPIPLDVEAVRRRLGDAEVQAYYRRAGININALLEPLLGQPPIAIGPADDRAVSDLNTDLYPRDEFAVPRSGRR